MLQAGTVPGGGRTWTLGIHPDTRLDEGSPSNGSAAALLRGGRAGLQLIILPHRCTWALLLLRSVPP